MLFSVTDQYYDADQVVFNYICSSTRHRLLDLQALPGRVTVETLARFATDPTERAELFAISRPHNKELYKEQIAGGML